MFEKKTHILNIATNLIFRLGVRAVTMDEIARDAGVSKKTLYEIFEDKSHLVAQCVQMLIEQEVSHCNQLKYSNPSAIEQVAELFKAVILRFGNMHPSVPLELKKYFPEAYRMHVHFMEKILPEMVAENLQLGIQQGYYRSNIDVPIIAIMYLAKLKMIFEGELFPTTNYDLSKVFSELFRYHIRGIASQKGIDFLVQKMQKGEITLYEK